jgi:hypothetical protein
MVKEVRSGVASPDVTVTLTGVRATARAGASRRPLVSRCAAWLRRLGRGLS